jgi:carbamoyltransferase
MKLLGLRLCDHDSNISYFDGDIVHYVKTERLLQDKHHGYNNLYEWVNTIKELWNITPKDIDYIGIVLDPWRYGLPKDSSFPHVDYNLFEKNNKVLKINHHYAHHLSAWPLHTDLPSSSIIIDGYGDYNISWTVIKEHKIIDQGYIDVNGSLGQEMQKVGDLLKVRYSHEADIAGKVMGIQAYGKLDKEFLETLNNYSLKNIKELFNFDLWVNYKKDFLIASLNMLDWLTTIHYKTSKILLDTFISYFNFQEKIVYAGGVAQNVIWNAELKKQFPNLIVLPHCADEGLSLGIIEYLRRINNLPKFKPISFPYIGYQKNKNLYEQTRRAIQRLTS